jgi:anti-sigma factor RsiW
MTCEEYKEQISAFLDGELPDNQAGRVFEHLPTCSDCRAFLSVLMKVRKAVAAEEVPWPEALDERILSEIGRRKTSSVSVRSRRTPLWARRFSWSPGFAAAAIILAFLLGGVIGSFLPARPVQELSSPLQVHVAEQARQPAAVLIIYSLPEIQTTGFVPAKYERVRSDTIY